MRRGKVLQEILTGPITVTLREEGGERWWEYEATATFARVLSGILGISAGVESESWGLYVDRGRVADDLDGEVRAVLKGQIEASRLSDTPSSRSWR